MDKCEDFELFDTYLSYDKETGLFRWKKGSGCNAKVGQPAGKASDGYVVIGLKGKDYRAHRVAWLLTYGKWPDDQIDHINGYRSDNRIENLREVSNRTNGQNQKRHREGALPGVIHTTHRGKPAIHAEIKFNGGSWHLGTFSNEESAHEAYKEAVERVNRGELPKESKRGYVKNPRSTRWKRDEVVDN
jgi:hypothetical protein